jgi:beta-aspartyl-peptidase (threonine type)
MKKAAFLLLILFVFVQCKSVKTIPAESFAIVIHGGADTILKKNMSLQLEAEYKAKLEEALKAGYTILKNGGSSLDAVEKTINIMEDSPLFNAGKGAVFTNQGKNELNASIMLGKTLNAEAVAGITTVKNPIRLARMVIKKIRTCPAS